MLNTYPNFHIDIAARVAALGRDPAPIRDLFLRHPSRILFGTDQLPLTGADYSSYRPFLETADRDFPTPPRIRHSSATGSSPASTSPSPSSTPSTPTTPAA
jgi:hypothetical protein